MLNGLAEPTCSEGETMAFCRSIALKLIRADAEVPTNEATDLAWPLGDASPASRVLLSCPAESRVLAYPASTVASRAPKANTDSAFRPWKVSRVPSVAAACPGS